MRDKNCFNCSNDCDCADCVFYNKWQPREQDFKVKSFTLPVEELFAKDQFNIQYER